MKKIRKLIILSLVLLWAALPTLPVGAESYSEYEGVQVMVKMDKEQYDAGETVTATITVVNTNAHSVTIANLEQLIPEGYVLTEGSAASTQNVELKSGQSLELKVTFEGEPAQPAEKGNGFFWDNLFYGSTLGIPNIFLIVIVTIAIVVFFALT